MTAFEGGWSVLKASGPPLNALFNWGDVHEDEYGYQDFRLPRDEEHAMTMSAGTFPAFIDRTSPLNEDSFVIGPAKGILRDPETGEPVITGRPLGSNINLAPAAAAFARSDQEMIDAIASTGRHEAIHQALEPILHDMGASEMRFGGFPSQYDRWTEWGANLAQYHDKDRAAEALRAHPVFRGNEYVQGRGLDDMEEEITPEMEARLNELMREVLAEYGIYPKEEDE
tara:strand:- start:226 stop:906 length:681 start_codon:yes stop_codon:yes gene_type:complete